MFELPWGFRQKKGYTVATFDMEHHDSMDFLKPSGFLFPGLFHTMALSPIILGDDLSRYSNANPGAFTFASSTAHLARHSGSQCSRCFEWFQMDFSWLGQIAGHGGCRVVAPLGDHQSTFLGGKSWVLFLKQTLWYPGFLPICLHYGELCFFNYMATGKEGKRISL